MTTVDNTNNLNPRRTGHGGCAGVNPRSLKGRWLTWKFENDKQTYQGFKKDSDAYVRQIRAGGSTTPSIGITGGGAIAGPTAVSSIGCLFFHMESTFGVHTSGVGLGGPAEHTDGNYVSGWRGVVNTNVNPITPATSATAEYQQIFFSSIAGTEVSTTSPRYFASAYTFTTPSGFTVFKPAIAWPLRSDASCGLEHIAFPQVSSTRGFDGSNGWCAVFVYQPSSDPRNLYTDLAAGDKLRHVFWGNITSGTNRYFMFNHSVFEGSGFSGISTPAVFHGVEEEVNLTSTHTLVTSSVGRGLATSDYTYSLYGSFGPVIQDWDGSLPVRVDSSSHPNIVMFNVSAPELIFRYNSAASANEASSVAAFEVIKVITSSNTGVPVYSKWTYRPRPGISDSPNEDLSGYTGPSTNPFFGAQDSALLSLGWSPSNNGLTYEPNGTAGRAGIRHTLSGIYLYEVWIFCQHFDSDQIYRFLQTVCGKYGLT